MQDINLVWKLLSGFLAGASVVYGFALKFPSYYLDVISKILFRILLIGSLFSYLTGLFIQSYHEQLIKKLNLFPEAIKLANQQWDSLFTFLSYLALFLTLSWLAWFGLGALLRSLEKHKIENSSQ